MSKLILFLIRKRLGLKNNEKFRFYNQKDKSLYMFTDRGLIKMLENGKLLYSTVSLNWLLNKKCRVIKY